MDATQQPEVPEGLIEALDTLADNFLASDAFLRYRHAVEQCAGDPQAVALLREQGDAIAFLREINQEISTLLGVDFARLAQRTTC